MQNILARLHKWLPDIFGGSTAMLVALPSAIAFGIAIFSTIGPGFASQGAMAGILGTVVIGLVTAVFGRTRLLISAPCAPAAAILTVFVSEMHRAGVPAAQIPLLLLLVGGMAGLLQMAAGLLGGGKLFKYIPYPVVAGYMTGVGLLILDAQLPVLAGLPADADILDVLVVSQWRWQALLVGGVAIVTMVVAPHITQKIPAAALAIAASVLCHLGLGYFEPALRDLATNPWVIGPLVSENSGVGQLFAERAHMLPSLSWGTLRLLLVPAVTLAVLLSLDTMKTCLILGAITQSRSDSNREIIVQGLANTTSSLCCGIPGAGTMGATLVNVHSGAKTRLSGLVEGVTALLVLLVFSPLVAWIPLSALAGILIVVGVRMIDKKTLSLLKQRSTWMDFAVIFGVVLAACALSLIWAAAVGVALSVVLFLRDQISRPVIRRRFDGTALRSKKKYLMPAMEILGQQGHRTAILELQGALFFGTSDQLLSEIERELPRATNLILHMRHVHAIDYSGAYILHQIETRVADNGGTLVIAALSKKAREDVGIRQYLKDLGFGAENSKHLRFVDTLEEALEWAEQWLLDASDYRIAADPATPIPFDEHPFFERVSAEAMADLHDAIETVRVTKGDFVFRRGMTGAHIYFVAQGTVRIVWPFADGSVRHMSSFSRGDFFGEVAFLHRHVRSADAIAEEDVTLYALRREKFDVLSRSHPRTTTIVFEQLARMLAIRLRQTNLEIEALEKS